MLGFCNQVAIKEDKENKWLKRIKDKVYGVKNEYEIYAPVSELSYHSLSSKADRYGGGGWKTIEAAAPAPKVDLGLPAQRYTPYTAIYYTQRKL